jgi:hypothetical protein
VGIIDGFSQFSGRKIIGQVAQPEAFPSQVDGICAVMDGNPQLFHIARGSQEFRLFHVGFCHSSPYI